MDTFPSNLHSLPPSCPHLLIPHPRLAKTNGLLDGVGEREQVHRAQHGKGRPEGMTWRKRDGGKEKQE
jgi:hypothetical protein